MVEFSMGLAAGLVLPWLYRRLAARFAEPSDGECVGRPSPPLVRGGGAQRRRGSLRLPFLSLRLFASQKSTSLVRGRQDSADTSEHDTTDQQQKIIHENHNFLHYDGETQEAYHGTRD